MHRRTHNFTSRSWQVQVTIAEQSLKYDSKIRIRNDNVNNYLISTVISLRRSDKTRTVIASLDGQLIDNFPLHSNWMRIEKLPEEISLLLLSNQVHKLNCYAHLNTLVLSVEFSRWKCLITSTIMVSKFAHRHSST